MVGRGGARWLRRAREPPGAGVLPLGLSDVTWVCSLCDNAPSHTFVICALFLSYVTLYFKH